MRTTRPFTNSFTKRVDHEAGRHHSVKAIEEPAICTHCGAVYRNRRWNKSKRGLRVANREQASRVVCPACKQAAIGEPRGFLYVDGAFYVVHRDDIENLILNEADRAGEDNPLARILELTEGDGHQLTVTTTTEHLAQRLGHALEKAFDGKATYNFSHENKVTRVSWER